MLKLILCLALVVHTTVAQEAPGCALDVIDADYPCGQAFIGVTECQQLGCCWRENECRMWGGDATVGQGELEPNDTPVQIHEGYTIPRCSATVATISGGWDWAYSVDQNNVCKIYSSRWHIYRTQQSWTTINTTYSFETLTWSKAPRDENENFGDKATVLQNLLLGCYPVYDSENQDIEDVETELWTWEKNTAERCVASCRSAGYQIAATRGNRCFCTDRALRREEPVAENLCNVPCPGDSFQKCGGAEYNSVYFVSPQPRFLGCYNDTAPLHQWDEWYADELKSADECIAQCSIREDNSQNRYYHHFAFVGNNGDCWCADQKTIVENGLVTDPMACMGRCQGVQSSRADLYCGNPGVAAIYSTFHNLPQRPTWTHLPNQWYRPLVRRLRFMETDVTKDQKMVPIDESTMTGISTNLFTEFPELQTILSPRLIIHATESVIPPYEAQRCGPECWEPCGQIWFPSTVVDNRNTVNIRAWYINLKDIFERVGPHVRRVYLYAQVVVIDEDLHFPFSLTIRARQIVLDRSKAYYLSTKRDTPVLVDDYFSGDDTSPAADNLFQKMVTQCGRILMDNRTPRDVTTAMEMLDDVVRDHQYDKEQAAYKSVARLNRAEFMSMIRDGYRHVPFFTKEYFRAKLSIHHRTISTWNENYRRILDSAIGIDLFLSFTQEMLNIFVSTSISQWEAIYDEQLLALQISNATFHAMYNNFSVSRENLEVARQAFEQGLNDYANSQRRRGFRGFIRGVAKMVVGIFTNPKMIVDGLKDFITTLQNLEETMDFLTRAMEKVEAMVRKLEYLIAMLEDIIENGDVEEIASDVEMIAQLRVKLVGWDNMKHNSIAILSHPDALQIAGSQDYLTAILDTCNWGYALTESMLEITENYRRLMLIKAMLQNKKEMQIRYNEYIDECRENNEDRFHLVNRMTEMQHDLRIDINDLLLDYCDLHMYEHQTMCSAASRPSFDGDLSAVLLRLDAAENDAIWGSGVPGDTCRPITIRDTVTDDSCNDAVDCPVKVFRETGMLRFTIPENHTDFLDIDRYRIGEIYVDVKGAKSGGGPNDRLKLDIETAGPFGVKYNKNWNYFISRSVWVVYEYDVITGAITWRAPLYQAQSSNIFHRSPFSTWIFKVNEVSNHIDLSDVTEIEIVFDGSGFSNNPKDDNAKPDPRCSKYGL